MKLQPLFWKKKPGEQTDEFAASRSFDIDERERGSSVSQNHGRLN